MERSPFAGLEKVGLEKVGMRKIHRTCLLLSLVLAGCGGGGGGDSDSRSHREEAAYFPGTYRSSADFAAQCASPRQGVDPYTGQRYFDQQGSLALENHWLRSWTNELYLWYDEVPDLDPNGYTTADYFGLMRTSALTDGGSPKDKFHYAIPTNEWLALAVANEEYGYGLRYVVTGSAPNLLLSVAFVEPTPAPSVTAAGVQRGARILAVDGVYIDSANDDAAYRTLNAGLSPATAGETHTFILQDANASEPRTVTLSAARVTHDPVPAVSTLSTSSGNVGYLLFNDHLMASEAQLVDAINTLNSANIQDLVLDLRYNGGGLLDIASELSYMIAGPSATAGMVFENTVFNDKFRDTNPFTGTALEPTGFHATAMGFSVPAGDPLPSLNLSRVYVLTSEDTCSASESLINGLRGINVEVILVGGNTCGKPYGFYPADNCGTTYFSIQMRGENAVGFGDYSDGFAAVNDPAAPGVKVAGCAVEDDLAHALGDSDEAMLGAALHYREAEECPGVDALRERSAAKMRQRSEQPLLAPSVLRSNKFLRLGM